MLILHAGFLDNRWYIWGETPAESAALPPKRRGPKSQAPRSAACPFDPGADRLLAAASAGAASCSLATPEKKYVWLPSFKDAPLASSPLIAETPASKSEPKLRPWEVAAVPFTPSQTLEWLCRCADKRLLSPGVVLGADAVFWAQTMRFAGEVAARQHFLPGIAQVNGAFHARWESALIGDEIDRLTALSRRMPSVCRALASEPAETAPATPARIVLTRFVDLMIDEIVRSSIPPVESQPEATEQHPPASAPKRGRKASRQTSVESSPQFPSLHDQWLYRLRSRDSELKDSAAALRQLAEQVREWRRPIHITASAPFRLCFKLEEPISAPDDYCILDTRSSVWQVSYLLQARDDPSLFIPATDAFNARNKAAQGALKRTGFNAREYLLFALGQAMSVCPRIESSLRTPAPGGFDVDETGAVEFLCETGLALQNAGFAVLYPAWWTGRGSKRRLTTQAKVKSPKMSGGGGLTLESIITFDWAVALGEEKLTLKELQQLAKLKAPLVKVRGEWALLDPKEIQTAVEAWKQKSNKMTLQDLMKISLGAIAPPAGIPLENIEASGWIDKFLAKLDGRSTPEELATPAGFHGILRPYQTRGYSWLDFLKHWGLGACLADDMGLGKTIQALALLQRYRENSGTKPTLLVCPTSVIGNWGKEAEKFTPGLAVMVHHGGDRLKEKAFKKEAGKAALVISSYALLHRDLELLKQIEWSGVILDEAQNVKNPETKQSRAARSLIADFRIAMTGTPVENNVGDLWSIMEFLNPGFLGKQSQFKREYFLPIQTGRDPEAADRLKRITGPFILRRLKTDKSIISDLPEKIENKVYCSLTKEQASLYAAVTEEALKALKDSEGIQRKGLVLTTLMKLKQICNHPAQFLKDNSTVENRSGKLTRLTEMLEELLEAGDRALLFTQFQEMGSLLQGYLQDYFGREALYLHGSVAKAKRDKMIERFQSNGGGPNLFILSLKAGGTGLNLTSASHVFHFDRWWNPAVENQATDRAFRIGQKRNVLVHKFLCLGTLEERIDEMIERKKEIASLVVGAGEGWLTELSTAELKELFTLRNETERE